MTARIRTQQTHPTGRDTEWRARAACRGHDPELFFPISGMQTCQIEQAKQVCAACPVRQQCLQHALETGEDHGIWGGKTSNERRKMRRTAA